MSTPATFNEIVSYLQALPAASPSWAEGIYSAKLSLSAIEKLVTTMTHDVDSPLRRSEEGILSKEILKLNQDRGSLKARGTLVGKFQIKLKVVLSPSEQTRVCRIVNGFAQPSFDTYKKFGKNGHAVMNAVRRVLNAYITTKVPDGGSIVEVGPDIKNWILSPSPSQWSGSKVSNYKAARPVLSARDAVRVEWRVLAEVVLDIKNDFYSAETKDKVMRLQESYDRIFVDAKIQDGKTLGEYILSYDSNYDIAFSDMPVAMAACRARAWYGVMVRAKGLSRQTRLTEGQLDLMGVHYRVDWKSGRIDFRHPECSAFGYSHNVWEYMKYEEHNGFVWTTRDCHYVYTKGPETTDELLFFQVVRVPKVHKLREPRFIENPHAGQVELTSVWAVGDETNGLPNTFQKIKFHVDALNFSKVLEKRRALDFKGSLPLTVSLVRSTNVRFWIHGTPVGVNSRIEARLAEATAVVVEALAAEKRLAANMIFDEAMFQYNISMPRAGWLRDMLSGIIDMKVVVGSVAAPILRVWNGIRAAVIDKALSPLGDIHVGAKLVDSYSSLRGDNYATYESDWSGPGVSECLCGEVAELRAAIEIANESDKGVLESYLLDYNKDGYCKVCELPLEKLGEQYEAGISEDEIEVSSSIDDESDSYHEDDDTSVTSLSYQETNNSWSDDKNISRVESRSMNEFCELEEYLITSQLTEFRVDATRIFDTGPISDTLLADFTTARTKHAVLHFVSGKCVCRYGPYDGDVGAIYDLKNDVIVPVRTKTGIMRSSVSDGYYYTCNKLKIWNGPDLISAVKYAISYGYVSDQRSSYVVHLGVPGAGKTYMMMERIAEKYKVKPFDFLALSTTKASVFAALKYGKKFGIPLDILKTRVMTLDRYLMHCKFPCDFIVFDEFPMVHIAKVDAAVSIAKATDVVLYGDARQIPYDPFCAEFNMSYATLGDTVKESQVFFHPKSHRLASDVCAMWIDQYPSIYPCDCCSTIDKDKSTCEWIKVRDLNDLKHEIDVRYHTYKQDEKGDLKTILKMPGDVEDLRVLSVGGLSTVHEDQGSTHSKVITVRLSVDFDKNASPRNPSLYNRERYVLTDTTRHTESYTYYTMCDEYDLIRKRIDLSKDVYRLDLVANRKGMGAVVVSDML